MSHSRSYDKTDPTDSIHLGLVASEIRDFKEDIEERMQLDHQWTSGIDSSVITGDGNHKKITLKETTKPTKLTGAIIVYTKDVSGNTELFCLDEDDTETQITSGGHLKFGNIKLSAFQKYGTSVLINDYSEYNNTTFLFTVSQTGTYFISCLNSYAAITSQANMTVLVKVNGNPLNIIKSMILNLTAGDVVTGISFAMRIA